MTACVEIIRFVKTCILSEDREAARQLHSLIITLSTVFVATISILLAAAITMATIEPRTPLALLLLATRMQRRLVPRLKRRRRTT